MVSRRRFVPLLFVIKALACFTADSSTYGIIAKVKPKYWVKTHKFGIKVPKSVEQAVQFDKENEKNLWWDAICQEMKNP